MPTFRGGAMVARLPVKEMVGGPNPPRGALISENTYSRNLKTLTSYPFVERR